MRARLGLIVGETFRSLGHRNFRLWLFGQGISQVGYFAQTVGLALLMLRLSDSGAVLGLVLSLNFVPCLVVGPWAGVLSDRLDKRRLLIVTQSVMMVCALWLGWLVLSDVITLPWVVVVAALGGFAFAFDQPARRTIVTELVADDDAANAVSLSGALNQAAKVIGPTVAAVLVDGIGIGWCFLVNGISSIAVLAALVAVDTAAMRRTAPVPRARGQISAGFRYLWSDPAARGVLVMLAVVMTLGFNWNVLLPLLATRDLGGTSATFALLTGSMSLGSLLGLLWLARRTDVDLGLLARSCIAFGVTSIGLSFAPSSIVATVAAFGVGVTSMVLVNGGLIALQLGAVPTMRGRVMAIFGMVVLGGYAIGSPLAGWIADLAGTRSSLFIGAVTSLIAGLAVAATAARSGSESITAVLPSPGSVIVPSGPSFTSEEESRS